MLHISMLGKVRISLNGENLSGKLSQKMVALICLLVINRGKEISREKITSYFWPDSDEEASKYNLRYNLWMIRKLVPNDVSGESLILTEKDACRINEHYAFSCDKLLLDLFVPRKEHSLEELNELHHLFQGDFLEGLYLKNCNEFNELILFERVVCQNKQIEILKQLSKQHEKQSNYEDELLILEEMEAIEPYNEEFAFRILEIMGKLGKRTTAIQHYKKFEAVLRRDLNIQPDQKLKILYTSLLEEPCYGVTTGRERTSGKRDCLKIEAGCMKGVDYFLVADIISGIMRDIDKSYMLSMERKYILDLGFVQNELLLAYEKYVSKEHEQIGTVPDVRIINAFCKFILHVSERYDLKIKVNGFDDVDPVSRNVIQHMQQSGPKNLHFQFQNNK